MQSNLATSKGGTLGDRQRVVPAAWRLRHSLVAELPQSCTEEGSEARVVISCHPQGAFTGGFRQLLSCDILSATVQHILEDNAAFGFLIKFGQFEESVFAETVRASLCLRSLPVNADDFMGFEQGRLSLKSGLAA
ncbi:hypothetical protein TREES_T100011914 [Tupaia chinensis]|uniref:Uncharacterized protein n=1 Tax=Tupaia chinensis TaxID=246437 RepID=L9KXR6_TUPCH|nr:hypothetical protein TREES_T100011914 [Tupaia chinensis]